MTTMNLESQAIAFDRFRPVCVELTKGHTRGNVAALQREIHDTTPTISQELQEYVLFPLRLILKQSTNKSEDFYTDVFSCMAEAFNKMKVIQWSLFQDCFTSVCVFISSADPSKRVAVTCEELKLAVVTCLSALVDNTVEDVLKAAYLPSFLPALGHAVSLLLHLLEAESMRELRLACISCLIDLSSVNRKLKPCTRHLVGDCFAAFLPGISMALTKVATGDQKQGHHITKSAVEAWAKVVVIVLGDDSLELAVQKADSPSANGNQPYSKLIVTRSPEWVSMTTSKLKVLVDKMAPLAAHESWKVRRSMIDWAQLLLTRCRSSMQCCLSQVLEVLVSRVSDSYPRVSAAAKEALTTFQKSETSSPKKSTDFLVEILEENLHKLATGLPRLMRSGDDKDKHCTLCLFNGYLRLLGPHLDKLLHSTSHLQRISLALLQVLELDCSGVTIIQEHTSSVMFSDLREHRLELPKMRKYFVQFNDEKIYNELSVSCRLLGYYGNLDIIVDHFLEKFLQSTLYRKQSAIILNEILQGVAGDGLNVDIVTVTSREPAYLDSIVKSILGEYLQPEHWDVLTSNHSTHTAKEKVTSYEIVPINRLTPSESSLRQINSNIVQVCLLLEGVGNCAALLGSDFQYHLMDVLYPVLEKLGNDNTHSETAYNTLIKIAESCDCSSISELILRNSDYLVSSISLKLRHLNCHPRAPLVLKVMLKYSSVDLLPLVTGTVHEVLHSLDEHFNDDALLFLHVLQALVVSISKWFPSKKSAPTDSGSTMSQALEAHMEEVRRDQDTERTSHATIEEISEYFREYHRNKEIADNLDADIPDCKPHSTEAELEDVQADIEPMEADTPKTVIPKHVKMTMEVLERCGHLLAAPDPRIRLLTLDIFAQCCLALQASENELLPLVHKVWSAFALRFLDEEQLVVIKSFKVLKVIAETTGDFVRQRTVKDVIPKLISALSSSAQTSVRAGAAYKHTLACKLQLAILENIGPLSAEIGLMEHHLGQVLEVVLPYLSARQHPVLQCAALEAFYGFARLEPDHVWLVLNDVAGPGVFVPSHNDYPKVKMAGSKSRNEYSDNVKCVLEKL